MTPPKPRGLGCFVLLSYTPDLVLLWHNNVENSIRQACQMELSEHLPYSSLSCSSVVAIRGSDSRSQTISPRDYASPGELRGGSQCPPFGVGALLLD